MAVTNLGRLAGIALLALLAEVAFDFFLHAGLLSGLYSEPSPFLLPLETAFRLIPLGYLSFLILTVLLLWLMLALKIEGWREGLAFGLRLGGLMWAAFMLGLASIAAAPQSLLLGWFFGQTIELGIAGLVIGAALPAPSLKPLFAKVAAFFLLCLVAGVVLQNL